jgi:predicted DsbA family dithiol-disulfide isomerase
MRITVWNDYICPWAYAARPQTDWLIGQVAPLDVEVITRSFELHPDLPIEGRPIRPDGRFDHVLDHIAVECERRGHPFVKPSRTPNSRRVLALAELVHAEHPAAFPAFDDHVARAHWVEGRPIDDDAVLASLLAGAGVDPGLIDEIEHEGMRLLAAARRDAMDVGATATPSWQIGDLLVTGLHDDAQFRRWIGRILERSD